MAKIFKVAPRAEWESEQAAGAFTGSPVDARDGFIHFSTRDQLEETISRHFHGQSDLVLAAVDAESLGEALKWEPSRGGALFPHLYGPLSRDCVAWTRSFDADDLASVRAWLSEEP